jgi:hypothetical protein
MEAGAASWRALIGRRAAALAIAGAALGLIALPARAVDAPADAASAPESFAVPQVSAEDAETMRCLAFANQNTAYPRKLQDKNKEGAVVALLRFTAADRGPEVKILENGGSDLFVDAVADEFASGRLPCLRPGRSMDVYYHYDFFMQPRGAHRELKDLALPAFLRGTVPPLGPAKFDTTTMGCPFDLRLTFHQPYQSNVVAELGPDVLARHGLMAWLAGKRLELGEGPTGDLLDQTMNIHVPCAAIDL